MLAAMIIRSCLACLLVIRAAGGGVIAAAGEPGSASPAKALILPGEVFEVAGRTAFLLTPADAASNGGRKAWILYAPTLPAYPDKAETWMHEQFLAAGVAVAGIDTGESYGSPGAVQAAEALHAEMVRRGYSPKPALLGRSRGGLWAGAWAIAHPDLTAGVGGIYPVYDWRTYPGVAKAAAAYGLSPEQLAARAADLCPIERIDVAARAGVPFCIIHGDDDSVVPLEPNSAELKKRYEAAGVGDLVTLIIAPGQGHSFWEGFFHCQPLVDFLISRAKAAARHAPRNEPPPAGSGRPSPAVPLEAAGYGCGDQARDGGDP
jgi:hypothetical protein